MLSDILMYGGVVGYVVVWVLYGISISLFTLSEPIRTAFFIYALVPWGVCTATVGGVLLKLVGW